MKTIKTDRMRTMIANQLVKAITSAVKHYSVPPIAKVRRIYDTLYVEVSNPATGILTTYEMNNIKEAIDPILKEIDNSCYYCCFDAKKNDVSDEIIIYIPSFDIHLLKEEKI